ncbi:sugar ABC transporter ATP-binding protein [Vallitalea pronyensis]|uniref:Ribose/galactose/methyl galactoside import ATP-binding protein n=1 Tax=Vallitalea pronyensis TaxID=1348613 RepID=A0A8J8SI25_9FIRM|nr:sugar ABC transporter ATP-binding protein [Vallitalea pronyensis]QUI24029.1 sugar ABC transporter ATP-binding protein [Vallitalea pronyensis]
MSNYVLEMKNIVKVFPGVRALDGVCLRLKPGHVHALMGENGAGKSTLMKCIIGIHPPTSGEIVYKGKKVNMTNTNKALQMGISMIHQELSPILHRSIMENIWLGREPKKGFFVDHKKMYQQTKNLLDSLDLNLDPKEKMANLTVAKMQMIEIAKAVSYNSEVVIMDEPTSALTDREVEHLFRIIQQLKAQGTAIVYISHKMDEIFQISDEITVLRDGQYVATHEAKALDTNTLIQLMVGRELDDMFPKIKCDIGEERLRVEKLTVEGVFHDVSFCVRKGEILGIAGLVGAGRTEVIETIFGIRKKTSGCIIIEGEEVDIKSPEIAIHNKLALLTEDRRHTGIFPMLSVKDNMVIANMSDYIATGFVQHKKIVQDCDDYKNKIRIKTPSLNQQIQNLSGGNQQKVLVARWLLTQPDILILDEPTRGIDVGAKSEIHSLITELAAQGKSIIMISSELPEILGMSDTIVVMHEGKVTGRIDREDANQERIMQHATNTN